MYIFKIKKNNNLFTQKITETGALIQGFYGIFT
jgi:hypothetical protein